MKITRWMVVPLGPTFGRYPPATDRFLIQGHSKTREVRKVHFAIANHRLFQRQVEPHRIAFVIRKYLDADPVGDTRQEMQGDLGLLVMRHAHAKGRSHAGDSPPLSDSASDRDVDVEDINGAPDHQIPAAVTGDFALSRIHRDADGPHSGVALDLVIPADRFLQPC